jgi:hypothetical protein
VHCFNHPEREALGVCKSCCKGLCADCAADLGHGIACRGTHEDRVEALNALVLRSQQVQSTAGRFKYVGPALPAVMGVLFLGYGYFWEGMHGFLFPLGAAFLVYGAIVFVANRRAYGRRGRDA